MSNHSHGPRNSISDIAGIEVGNAQHAGLRSGVTAVLCPPGTVASVAVLGGAPGTRETDLLDPANSVETVDAVLLSGGSAFGLDAASGAQAWLREQGRGLQVAGMCIPIVPAAILFDLANGGDKDWGRFPPYRELGYAAAANAGSDFAIGTAGAGYGALTSTTKGGLGTASARLSNGSTVAALVAANPVGTVTIPGTRHFWAAPFEIGEEFGGIGLPDPMPASARLLATKLREAQSFGANTTIGIIATDAALTKAEARRLAIAAHDGYSRAIWPSHTPLDGDLIFSLSTRAGSAPDTPLAMMELCAVAAMTMARAVARGIYHAAAMEGDLLPAWSQLA